MLLSSALNDSKIRNEEFTNIIAEKNMYENMKENTKDTAEPSSLERIKKEEEKSTAQPTAESSALARSSLERTTLQKSFKILIIF